METGKKLIYENPLREHADIKSFRLEGSAAISFPQGRLRLENTISAEEEQKANYVLWCPEEFPANIQIDWDFWPIREPGLCVMFFAAKGRNGEDLFASSLKARHGDYAHYHHGDIDAYHISYFRRRYPEERAFHTCNLRKSYGFYLTAQGADPIPDVGDAKGPYHITIIKQEAQITFRINNLEIFSFKDDGITYGPLLEGGKIGFRQMAPLIGEYADLKVWELEKEEEK